MNKAGSRGVTADLGSGIYYSRPEGGLQRLQNDWIALDLKPVTAASGAPSARPGEEGKGACSPVAPGESANEPSGETTQKPAVGAGSGEKKANAEAGTGEQEAQDYNTNCQEKLMRKEVTYL